MKLKYSFIAFIVSLITTLGFRIYEVINMGCLVKSQLGSIETICLGCTVFFAVLIILMSCLSKNIPQKFKLNKNIFLSTLSFIVGALAIINGIGNILNLFTDSQVEIILLFTGVLSILSGIIFFVLGVGFSAAKNVFLEHQLIILIPVLWFAVRLYQMFLQYRNVTMQVQLISGELAVIFLLLYFMHFSKLLSGLYEQKVYKKLVMYGLSGAIFTFMSVTYGFFEMSLNRTFSFYDTIQAITDLALALFVVSFIYFLNKNNYSIAEKKDEAEENDDEQSFQEQAEENSEEQNQVIASQEISAEEANGGKTQNFNMDKINKLIDEISN